MINIKNAQKTYHQIDCPCGFSFKAPMARGLTIYTAFRCGKCGYLTTIEVKVYFDGDELKPLDPKNISYSINAKGSTQ